MRIKFHTPVDPATGKRPEVFWPNGWPVPRVGDQIDLEGQSGPHSFWVRRVIWCVDARPRPYVYVVLTTTPQ